MNNHKFSALPLSPEQLHNLHSLGYEVMTPIQSESLPHILAGDDVIAQSKTGSGKTAAFGLGLLANLDVKRYEIQTVVLCPTRELAEQVSTEIRHLARALKNVKLLTLTGGRPLRPQAGSLAHGAHIVVGTPGRIEDHIGKNSLKLNQVNTLILDEADRMFEMGFQSAIEAVIEAVPSKRQTLLFSATYPPQIKRVANRVMAEPITVKTDNEHSSQSIEQYFYELDDSEQREHAIRILLLHFQPESALVFCNTKKEVRQLVAALSSFDFSVLALHGDMEQKDRDQTLIQFSNRSVSLLVATDVAARGLDVNAIDTVINYQMAHDPQTHIHRVGRTGRAGGTGAAYTFWTPSERHKVNGLAEILPEKIQQRALPSSSALYNKPNWSPNRTLQIDGGRKQKVRAGDILGALTGADGIAGDQVGTINLADNWSFVAVNRKVASHALRKLNDGKLKGKSFRARFIGQ